MLGGVVKFQRAETPSTAREPIVGGLCVLCACAIQLGLRFHPRPGGLTTWPLAAARFVDRRLQCFVSLSLGQHRSLHLIQRKGLTGVELGS